MSAAPRLLSLLTGLLVAAVSSNSFAWETLGSGVAKWGVFKVYSAKLEAPKRAPVSELLQDQVPLKLTLCYARTLKKEDIIKATTHAVGTPANGGLNRALVQINKALAPVVNKGDCYTLEHATNGLTTLSLNKKPLVNIMQPGFKKMYFGIWIGSNPLSDSLKQQLLGRS